MNLLFDTTEYLSFNPVIDSYWDESLPEQDPITPEQDPITPEQDPTPENKALEQDNSPKERPVSQWTERYSVRRGDLRHFYYRYCYYLRGKIFHIHIPGGNSCSEIAIHRRELIDTAISSGWTHFQIENMIRGGSFRSTP
jgi:hypothetical protein